MFTSERERVNFEQALNELRKFRRIIDEVTFDNICDKYQIPPEQRKLLYFM